MSLVWHREQRRRRGCAGRRVARSGSSRLSSVPGALRPLLEAALVVAAGSDGSEADPPAELVPFLRFSRYPTRALQVTLRVLDDDAQFRERVAATVDRDQIGSTGRLVLDHPGDWRERVAELSAAEVNDAQSRSDARDERRARRLVDKLEARLRDEQARHQQLSEQLGALRNEVADLRQERDRLTAGLAGREVELEKMRTELHSTRQSRDDLAASAREARSHAAELERARAHDTDAPSVDAELIEGLQEVLGDVHRLEHRLVTTLGALGADVDVDAETSGAHAASGEVDSRVAEHGGESSVPGEHSAASAPRRRPAPMPGGIVDDTPAGLEHLLRLGAVVLLVDGYNVSLGAWPELPLAVQRRRLVDGLRNLQARTGAEPIVIFDGAEADTGPSGSLPRSVQVRFSPAGVPADDLVVEGIDRIALDRAVVVVSSDREVRERSRDAGANVVSSSTLAALLS